MMPPTTPGDESQRTTGGFEEHITRRFAGEAPATGLEQQVAELAQAVRRARLAVATAARSGSVVVSIHNQPVAVIEAFVEQERDPDAWMFERMCITPGFDGRVRHLLAALLHPTGELTTRVAVYSVDVDHPDRLPLNRGCRP